MQLRTAAQPCVDADREVHEPTIGEIDGAVFECGYRGSKITLQREEASELPTSQQPKNGAETALFLAAINDALMEAVDDLAEKYLVQAGYALIGEEQQ